MSALASQWLIETFLYTGALIALVLVLRRPVARYFGPQIAYALWALPGLRFIMPPLVLPASMAPAGDEAARLAMASTTLPAELALMDVLAPVWLLGAAVFLAWRVRGYGQMRRNVLTGACPAGESGTVRLVETAGVTAPVAFGVCDKVIALPPGFMAQHDRKARDLAIEHELAHHRGNDLLANILAQPVLALHWFNPLAWWGWRALRKDQETACDARVMAGRERAERAAYACVIASFAAGNRLALAAPMACPVLGEKSIIHRLRSLSMVEVSARRRRLGLAMLTVGALAVPATASVTYQQSDVLAVSPPPTAAPETAPMASQASQTQQPSQTLQSVALPPEPPLAPAAFRVPAVPPAPPHSAKPPAAPDVPLAPVPRNADFAADTVAKHAVSKVAPVAAPAQTVKLTVSAQAPSQMAMQCAGRDGMVICHGAQVSRVLVNLESDDAPTHRIFTRTIQIRRYTANIAPKTDDCESERHLGEEV